jgi:radical SAM superfamily enzyme YgiQ (UPF0313 family)
VTICLVNPALVSQRDDFLGSGIPYMPHGLAYLAAVLRRQGHDVRVVDAFGEMPSQVALTEKYAIQGLSVQEAARHVPHDAAVVAIYAGSVMAGSYIEAFLAAVKAARADLPTIVFENTQAVTGFSLEHVLDRLRARGADYVVTGEAETRVPAILRHLGGAGGALPDGVWRAADGAMQGRSAESYIEELDGLPFPAWDLLPLRNYWKLGYAHGPLSSRRYLAQLTSRGCPFACRFCVVPTTNRRRWRARSARNVVEEMHAMRHAYGVREFHWEDLNPTTSDARIREIAEEILRRSLDVTWKLVSGTKAETIKEETLNVMARSGCRYVSFSPESGSARVLAAMGKPFDHERGLWLTRRMMSCGIYTQACFVIGFPGETDADLAETERYIKALVRAGVDEVAIFIMAPVPGSAVFSEFGGYEEISQLTFSPAWREGYARLEDWRRRLYSCFLFGKIATAPIKCAMQGIRLMMRRFETKMEMTPYRIMRMKSFMRRGKTSDGFNTI